MAYKLGLEGIFARNTASYASPTWDVVPNVIDIDLVMEADEADMSNRNTGGFEVILPALKKVTVEAEMNYDPDDADFVVLRDAWLNRTLIEYAIADGAIATVGTQYLRAHMYVTKLGRKEALREGMKVPLTLRPGYTTNANPAWVTAS